MWIKYFKIKDYEKVDSEFIHPLLKPNCKDAKSSAKNIVSRPEILEHSKPLESNVQISFESEITPGNQIRLE